MLTLEVSRYCILGLQSSIVRFIILFINDIYSDHQPDVVRCREQSILKFVDVNSWPFCILSRTIKILHKHYLYHTTLV